MTPVIQGKVHHFAARGLYNGLFLMGDDETRSFWDHTTGECLHGPLKGTRLEVSPLLHMNVAQAKASDQNARIAISQQSLLQRVLAFIMERNRRGEAGRLPPNFKKTMGEEDNRRPRMEKGLGVWTTRTQRFYPLKSIHLQGKLLIDDLDGRRLLGYIDPLSDTPAALYTGSSQAYWQGDVIHLDGGKKIERGVLRASDGSRENSDRPMQMFTRWYGFAFTFQGCEVYTQR